jgi:hypothetical protein
VLFPPEAGHITRAGNGQSIPVVALLPLLHHDIEQFAAEEAMETLANRPQSRIHEELAPLPENVLTALLHSHAGQRWEGKKHFARIRIERLGWREACHHAALEILGYRFNRAPMLRVAGRYPLERWERGAVELSAAFEEERMAWSLQGVRPANRPDVRLKQYANWCRGNFGWPERLAALADAIRPIELDASARLSRRPTSFPALRDRLGSEICSDAITGTRFDNLVCDGFLPLLAARTDSDLIGRWYQWYPGDMPPVVTRALRALEVAGVRHRPLTHGIAQGLLGWLISRESKT